MIHPILMLAQSLEKEDSIEKFVDKKRTKKNPR
jgi:hypothetical protein